MLLTSNQFMQWVIDCPLHSLNNLNLWFKLRNIVGEREREEPKFKYFSHYILSIMSLIIIKIPLKPPFWLFHPYKIQTSQTIFKKKKTIL